MLAVEILSHLSCLYVTLRGMMGNNLTKDAHFVLNINVGASVQEKFNNGWMAVRRGDGESGLIKL